MAYRVINKTPKDPFKRGFMWSVLIGSKQSMPLPHPCYLSVHSFRSPDERGLIVNKAKGLTELWTPAVDQTILFARVR